jgi:hypothetical protein
MFKCIAATRGRPATLEKRVINLGEKLWTQKNYLDVIKL